VWHNSLADSVAACNQEAAHLIRQLPEDVAMIAACMPVDTPNGVHVRNMGAHVIVRYQGRDVSITWTGGWWLVWSTGVVVGEFTGFDSAVRFAGRHVMSIRVDPAGL